ncbi:MAG: diphthine--ammonia ligase [Verrucomicrobiota bacterium]|nr:diphthine--ammonia ligase [Verrucomicrobiota bacterium]
MKEKILFCWSGGKDSALALNRLRKDDRYEVVSLLTTCNEHFQRVSMHGVRLELLDRQAQSLGLPLQKVFVSRRSSNDEYQEKMSDCLRAHQARGVTACAFGDIFLEDLKRWREENLARIGMRGVFPIWKADSRGLLREFFALGFGTVVCCVNDAWLDETAVGRNLDEEFISSLPANVDPCGENGEFHSFAFAGPVFNQPVKFKVGEKVYRPVEATHPTDSNSPYVCPPSGPRATRGFWFCDLMPA